MATRNGVTVRLVVEGQSLDSTAGVRGATSNLYQALTLAWAQGTGSGALDKVFFSDVATSTTPVDLDFAGGSNTVDPASGDSQTFSVLHGLLVTNLDATDSITIGGDAASIPIFDAVADSITLGPGESFMFAAKAATDGRTVTATTGDIIQLVASANTPSARVFAWGR